MPLQGTFDVLDFTEVVHLISGQQLTGRLHVRSRSFGAHLFFEDGLLVGADQSEHQPAATTGDVRGRIEEVCFEMLDAERGSFEFQPGKPSTLPVGERFKVDEVLAQARRRLDEWHELQELIPSLDLQPRLVLDLARSEVTFDRERWRMLTSIDGRRNLRAIGRVLNLSDFDVCRVMRTLIEDGIVELDGLGSLPASTRDAMPIVPAPGAAGRSRATPSVARGAGTVAVGDVGLPAPEADGWRDPGLDATLRVEPPPPAEDRADERTAALPALGSLDDTDPGSLPGTGDETKVDARGSDPADLDPTLIVPAPDGGGPGGVPGVSGADLRREWAGDPEDETKVLAAGEGAGSAADAGEARRARRVIRIRSRHGEPDPGSRRP